MKFYAATLTQEVTLRSIKDETLVTFPAGYAVSATPVDPLWQLAEYHLNANGPGGEWDTYDGYADASRLDIGEVIATCNE